MSGMSTETLTGHELDVAVARVLGWTDVGPYVLDHRRGGYYRPAEANEPEPERIALRGRPPTGTHFADGRDHVPHFSDASCSGLAPVLAWLEANRPTKAQAGEAAGLRNNVWGVSLSFDWDEVDRVWQASYFISGEWAMLGKAPTLPAAACRLLVAWAARKAAL